MNDNPMRGEIMAMPDGRTIGIADLGDGTFYIEFAKPNAINGERLVTPIRLSGDALDVLVAIYLKTKGAIL